MNQTIGETKEEGGFPVPTVTETGMMHEEKGDVNAEAIESVGRGERI